MINFSRRQLAKFAVDEMAKKSSISDISIHIAAVLILSGRKKEIELLIADIEQQLEDRGLLVRARITSAFPLSEELNQEISSQLKKLADVEEVVLVSLIDRGVLGGIKIETTNRTWDKTIKRQLNSIKEVS